MSIRSTTSKACAALCAGLFAATASAAPRPLDDGEMSRVRGADG